MRESEQREEGKRGKGETRGRGGGTGGDSVRRIISGGVRDREMREGERKVDGDEVEVMEGGDGEGRQMREEHMLLFLMACKSPPLHCALWEPRALGPTDPSLTRRRGVHFCSQMSRPHARPEFGSDSLQVLLIDFDTAVAPSLRHTNTR